jgi:hypothetical protein
LLRLTVHARQLPVELGACEDSTTLDYQSLTLNGQEFLLPRKAHFHVVAANGNVLDNDTGFSGCHEFHGESTLHFDAAPEATPGGVSSHQLATNTIPAGLPLPSP